MANFGQSDEVRFSLYERLADISAKISRSFGNITKSNRYYRVKKTVKSLLECYLAIYKVFSRSLRMRKRKYRRYSDCENSQVRESIRGGRKRGKRLNTN